MTKRILVIAFLSILAGATHAQIVTNGLVAYYPFNGDANDYSGNGNNGTNKGATIAPDRFGNQQGAYYFDGTGVYIEVPSDPAIEPDSFISVSIWVKAEDYTVRQTPLCKRLFHNADPYNSYVITSTDNNSSQAWAFGVSSGTFGTGLGVSNNTPITLTWTHIVGTYDGDSIRLFINGVNVNSQKKSGKLGYTDSTLRIGLGIPGSSLQYFKGWIDDVRIYNRVLTQTEIDLLFSNTTDLSAPSTSDVIAIYPNPASDYINLQGSNIASVRIFGISGDLKLEAENSQRIDVSYLAAGIYVIEIQNKDGLLRREKIQIIR